jgi:hypothetical protein
MWAVQAPGGWCAPTQGSRRDVEQRGTADGKGNFPDKDVAKQTFASSEWVLDGQPQKSLGRTVQSKCQLNPSIHG